MRFPAPFPVALVALVALVACGGCAAVAERVPVTAAAVRTAADELSEGRSETTLLDRAGHRHAVHATAMVEGLPTRTPSGDPAWRFAEIADACKVGASCPTDAPALVRPGASAPWLLEPHRKLRHDVREGIVMTAFVGGIATAQVGCFASWCSDGGKIALGVVDGVAVTATAAIFGWLLTRGCLWC